MVQFAPLNTPLCRRMQTLAATAWIVIFVTGGFCFSLVLLYTLVYTRLWWLALLYALWVAVDRDAPRSGGRRVEWVRRWTWWRLYREFFPVRLERTEELPTDRNYLFACYPHGVLCSGVFAQFSAHSPDFDRLFPGIVPTLHTLDQNFNMPIIRDLLLSLGMTGSSREAIINNLDHEEKGRASVLVVGGAAEALKSKPGKYSIILKPRKGFVRVAMQTGASLVPVFSFGETELYDQLDNPEGSLLRTTQERLRKIIGIAPVIFLGRGIFQYSFGIVPHRRPITVVVGKPIEVPFKANPTPEEVNCLHAEYTEALVELFERHKTRLLKHANVELKID